MAITKYICRCGNRIDKMTSYFIDGIRVTVCENCEEEFKNNNKAEAVDYEEVKKDASKQIIDTREK
jgi:ribosome-binding protein aMBF1 (putative translation factor)